MGVSTTNSEDVSGGEKIGAAKHMGRNLGVIVGVLALAGGIIGFQMYSGKQDTAKLATLEAFRSAYAQKCGAPPAFQGPAPEALRSAYLSSGTLPGTVEKQLALIGSGTPCEDVARALRAADYPMATAAAPQP